LDAPEIIVLTDVPYEVKEMAVATGATIVEKNNLNIDDYKALSEELTDGVGFDDIVVLNPHSAAAVSEISKYIARRGTMNLVGQSPLDDQVKIDVGRLHYDYIAFIGNRGPDIADSYGESRNRCEMRPNGIAVFIGAGGPMGQMHLQRALENPDGPSVLIATEVNQERLDTLENRILPLAEEKGRTLYVVNPQEVTPSFYEFVMAHSYGKGADDVIVSVPSAKLMEQAASLMNPNGMMVAFAGVPTGTMAPVNLSDVYLHNAQFTGTSGLTIDDQGSVLERANEGKLSPGRMVAAIGGMKAARDAIVGVMESAYPGKIVIFPQIYDLPLMGLDELSEKLPGVAEKLGPSNVWTIEAEAVLFEKYWKK
jgi:threonine dehydrogenase-like Zn-dependent dehydrogenase